MARKRLSKRQRYLMLLQMWLRDNEILLSTHYYKHIYKVPCYTSELTGVKWMQQLMTSSSGVRCKNALRLEKHVVLRLCDELQEKYGLKSSVNMSVLEKVGIFLYTLASGASNRATCERFQRSGETISRVMHEVLEAIIGRSQNFKGFAAEMLQPRDPQFRAIPKKILDDTRYKHFKGAIGCIDGTHINASIPVEDQLPYRSRKGGTSFNVMAVCDFDMHFTFVSAGWEGSAHDARVFHHALNTPALKYPHPPLGRYYLVDKGYPDKQGYLVPYSKVKYHQVQFQTALPRNAKEGFNYIHSSARSIIERGFGVCKGRWRILKDMPSYSISTQVDIIIACFALHNFILKHKDKDAFLDEGPSDEGNEEPIGEEEDEAAEGRDDLPGGMRDTRDYIAAQIWNERRSFRH